MKRTKILIPIFLLSAVLSGCAAKKPGTMPSSEETKTAVQSQTEQAVNPEE